MTITMTKEALIAKLADRLAAAKKEDARAVELHRKDEQRALAKFKDRCRAALRWDWKTCKKNGCEVELGYRERPSCPTSEAALIAPVLHMVKMDTRKSPFSVSDKSDIGMAINWLPKSERINTSVCND